MTSFEHRLVNLGGDVSSKFVSHALKTISCDSIVPDSIIEMRVRDCGITRNE